MFRFAFLTTTCDCGFCWDTAEAAATERLKEEWRGWRVARRKNAEENSLADRENGLRCRGREKVVFMRTMKGVRLKE